MIQCAKLWSCARPPARTLRCQPTSKSSLVRTDAYARTIRFLSGAAAKKSLAAGQNGQQKSRRSSASLYLAALALALPAVYYYSDYKERQTLSITRFVPCKITNIQPLTPQTSVYTVALPKFATSPPSQALTALYVAQPEIQIQRPFTPLQPLTPSTNEVQLLVKRYDEKGAEMSQYIHRQAVGDDLLLRGPEVTWNIDLQTQHISFIAGGTGITPFIQLVHQLRQLPPQAQPSLSLLYASSTSERAFMEEDIQNLLQTYSAPSKFHHVHTRGGPQDAQRVKLDATSIRPLLSQTDSKVLVCGPDSMVAAVAGPASPIPGRIAPVGGFLKSLGVKTDQVVRL